MMLHQPFKPLPFLRHRWAQTILGSELPFTQDLPRTEEFNVRLSDGDELVLEVNTPAAWAPSDRIVTIIHGLGGSSRAKYVRRSALHLFNLGYKVFRLNLRNCGQGFGKAKSIYHLGQGADLCAVTDAIATKHPLASQALVGYSLGGGLVLNALGSGLVLPKQLKHAVAVSAPIDLRANKNKWDKNPWSRFERQMVRRLSHKVTSIPGLLEGFKIDSENLRRCADLVAFDELVTVRCAGFKSIDEYYTTVAPGPRLKHIQVPTLILCAKDDPIIDTDCISRYALSPEIDLHETDHGGHLGFISTSDLNSRYGRWSDRFIAYWLS